MERGKRQRGKAGRRGTWTRPYMPPSPTVATSLQTSYLPPSPKTPISHPHPSTYQTERGATVSTSARAQTSSPPPFLSILSPTPPPSLFEIIPLVQSTLSHSPPAQLVWFDFKSGQSVCPRMLRRDGQSPPCCFPRPPFPLPPRSRKVPRERRNEARSDGLGT